MVKVLAREKDSVPVLVLVAAMGRVCYLVRENPPHSIPREQCRR